MVPARPEIELHGVGLGAPVAPGEALDYRRVDLRAVERDVDGGVVVEDVHRRLLARRGSFVRVLLRERRARAGSLPDGIVEHAVDDGGVVVRTARRCGLGGATAAGAVGAAGAPATAVVVATCAATRSAVRRGIRFLVTKSGAGGRNE